MVFINKQPPGSSALEVHVPLSFCEFQVCLTIVLCFQQVAFIGNENLHVSSLLRALHAQIFPQRARLFIMKDKI